MQFSAAGFFQSKFSFFLTVVARVCISLVCLSVCLKQEDLYHQPEGSTFKKWPRIFWQFLTDYRSPENDTAVPVKPKRKEEKASLQG